MNKFFSPLCWHSGFTMNMNILCNLLQGEKKMPLKNVQRKIITHTLGFTTKEPFQSKLQGRCLFPKSYWLKMAQLRSGTGAVNGDSRVSLPAFSSCEHYCRLVLKEGKRAVPAHGVFHATCETLLSLPQEIENIVSRGFLSKRPMNTTVSSLYASTCPGLM